MTPEEKEYKALLANVQECMKHKFAKEMLWHILSLCEIYSALPGKVVAGKREVGLDILSLLQDADPEFYAKLILEHIEV